MSRRQRKVAHIGPALDALDDIRIVAIGAVAAVSGVYAMPQLASPAWLLLPLSLCLVRRFPGRALIAMVCIAAAWALINAEMRLAARLPVAESAQTVWVSGRVVGLPDASGGRTRFLLDNTDTGRTVRLSWYRHAPLLYPGECLRLKIQRATPHGLANPGGFDYTGWLWRKGIDATGYVRQAGYCDAASVWTLSGVRAAFLERLAPVLAGRPMRGVIEALTLGVRHHISDAQWAVLRRTGTSHLVAISGLHIGLIAGLLFALARALALRTRSMAHHARWLAGVLAFLGALTYAALAGWALPTQRALIMVAVGLFAVATERAIVPGRALAWAALIVVIVDPAAVITPGFWLSFAAVGWLIWLSGQARGPWWLRWLWFQCGLMIVLAPVTLWFFGQTSLIAPLVNAILIPASLVIVPTVLATTLLTLVMPSMGAPALIVVAKALAFGWSALAWAAEWPGVAVSHQFASVLLLAAALVALIWLAAPLPGRLRVLAGVILLPVLLDYRIPNPRIVSGEMRLTVLDAGQQSVSVVRTAHHTLIYRAGRAGGDVVARIVLPYLRQVGRVPVEGVMIKHGVIWPIDPTAAIASTLQPNDADVGADSRPCTVDRHWRWDGVDFTLRPPPDSGSARYRDCVLRVVSKHGSLLFTGDIKARAERALVARLPAGSLASDVLIVPHHGSQTSFSPVFLNAVAPRLAIVSSGWQNRYGYPRAGVVARYRARGIRFYNTATSGAIVVRWPDSGVPEVNRWRVVHARFWQQPRPARD